MKLLFDLFPVILFFLSFKISEAKIDQTMGIVNRLLGSGIDPMQAPVILATSVAIVASILQVAFVLLKPTILYWIFASILIYGSMTGKNFIHKLIGAQIALPANIWKNLQKGWIGFFIVVGFINLAVAYSFSTEAWVNFKLFGLLGLTLAFTLAMGFYIAKYSPESLEDNVKSDAAPK